MRTSSASSSPTRTASTKSVRICPKFWIGSGICRRSSTLFNYKSFFTAKRRCVHPLAPSARGLRPQAVGERTVRLSEIFRAMARFSPSAPSGHRSPSDASATSPVSGESVSQREARKKSPAGLFFLHQCAKTVFFIFLYTAFAASGRTRPAAV